MTASPALLPELPERGAGEPIALLYAEIRAGLAVRTVPLLYRVMAPEPGCLHWVWRIVGPLARAGVLATIGAAATRALPEVSVAPPLAACRAAGLDESGADQAAAIVAAFNHANPLNLAALSILNGILATGRMPRADGVTSSVAVPPPLPVMQSAEVTADARTLMQFLASCGGRRTVSAMPTLWSALAAHPPALALAAASLAPGFANGTIDASAATVREAAAAALGAMPMVPAPVASPAIAEHLHKIVPFFAATIPTMIAIGARLVPLFAKDPE